MKALFITSEATPFAKTGGLADVSGALPKHLQGTGCDISVIMPYYKQVAAGNFDIIPTGRTISIPIRGSIITGEILSGRLPDSDVPIYFIRQDSYYDRDGLYGEIEGDYRDNCERFVFFARAALEAIKIFNWDIDIIHCNDWQSALVPIYLATTLKNDPAMAKIATLFTVHNLAYQGLFWHFDMDLLGLDWSFYTPQYLEFYGNINLLKGAMLFSTMISTVSKRYAKEIQTAEFGCGLEGVLKGRSKDLFGIINGIDYSVWDPATDPLIPANFDINKIDGKAKCKKALQKKCGLPVSDAPLIGFVGRLAEQKGLDIIAKVIDKIMAMDLQMVVLGTGEQKYHDLLKKIAKKYPKKLSANITFNNQLAHEIEAGCDMFLMPSRYEPCGLNQLYSLKYGAVPLVRQTGGLADTVKQCHASKLKIGDATGFAFKPYSSTALLNAIKNAVKIFDDRRAWKILMHNGMKEDWSWNRSAKEYLKLYKKAIDKHASKLTRKQARSA